MFLEDEVTSHYYFMKNLSALILSTFRGEKLICGRCCNYFYSNKKLKDHNEECGECNELSELDPETEKKVKELNFKYLKKPLKGIAG